MATRKPISLIKGDNSPAETWPDEPVRFMEDHVDDFLMWCVSKGSSDVTIQSDRTIYNEISGKLYPATYRPLDSAEINSFLNKIYGPEALAKLASASDLDLSYEIRPDRYSRSRFRVNITAVLSKGRDSVQITMRVLPSDPPTFEQLGIEEDIVKNWAPRQGLVVVTGPTGSGKTTLLAAGIRHRLEHKGGCGKILSYEAPIEYTYDNINSPHSLIAQSEIPRHLPDFYRGVRNALRRKPEIILVGEARDRETINAAIEAGQTGHTVYTTTHTIGVAATIRRMISTFEPEERSERAYALMESIRLVVTQALVPRIGGGRLGVREWMAFDDRVRERLLGMDFNQWSPEIQRMIDQYGQTMEKSATQAFEAKLIERRPYLMLTQSMGTGG